MDVVQDLIQQTRGHLGEDLLQPSQARVAADKGEPRQSDVMTACVPMRSHREARAALTKLSE